MRLHETKQRRRSASWAGGRADDGERTPHGRFCWSALLTVIVLLLAETAAAVPEIFFEPDTVSVEGGQAEFETALWLDASGDSIACFDLHLELDSLAVELLAAEEGELFSSAGYPTYFFWDSLSAGQHEILDCLLGYGSFLLGSGEIVCLRLRVVTDETLTTEFVLSEVVVTDIDRQEIPEVLSTPGYADLNALSAIFGGESSAGMRGSDLRARPNPTPAGISIHLRAVEACGAPGALSALLAEPGRACVTIHDIAGRRILSLPLRGSEGVWSGYWSGRDAHGRLTPPGVYFITLPAMRGPACRVVRLGPGHGGGQ